MGAGAALSLAAMTDAGVTEGDSAAGGVAEAVTVDVGVSTSGSVVGSRIGTVSVSRAEDGVAETSREVVNVGVAVGFSIS